MARLFILNRYFAPDESATSRMASSLAFALAERGWNVHAVTSRQLYGSPSAALPFEQEIRGVMVHRILTSRFGRSHLIGRALDYLTFYLSVFMWLLRSTHRGDLLIVARRGGEAASRADLTRLGHEPIEVPSVTA